MHRAPTDESNIKKPQRSLWLEVHFGAPGGI